ncbi:MAG: ABC transporter permease [Candidatus Hydrothermarchaeales archaeon]
MLQYIELTLKNLSYNKARSLLTLMGVIIGITAVISLVSIGAGMQASIQEAFETFGTNKIIISAQSMQGGMISTKGLTDDDARAVEKVPGVAFVSPMYSVATGSEFRGEEKIVTIWGLNPKKAARTFSDAGGLRILQGRWLQSGDRTNIVIGNKLHDDYYDHPVHLGNTIKIQDKKFTVVGIFMKSANREHDTKIFGDLDTMREVMGKDKSISAMVAKTNDGADVKTVVLRITERLKKNHDEDEFVVMSSQQLIENIQSAYKVVQVVFGGIAAVSLIVGGVGIANTMIMNVLERTREIGILKATGASNTQVMKIFIIEAGIIGIIGGSIGILLGYLISKLINVVAAQFLGPGTLTTVVTWQMVVLALSFSLIVGVLSGIYPAYKAVQLDPVEALRS